MATCLICPPSESDVPDVMIEAHMKLLHSGWDGDPAALVLIQAYRKLRQHAAGFRAAPEYIAAYAAFEEKPPDINRAYKYARMEEFVSGFEAAAHALEHMIAEVQG